MKNKKQILKRIIAFLMALILCLGMCACEKPKLYGEQSKEKQGQQEQGKEQGDEKQQEQGSENQNSEQKQDSKELFQYVISLYKNNEDIISATEGFATRHSHFNVNDAGRQIANALCDCDISKIAFSENSSEGHKNEGLKLRSLKKIKSGDWVTEFVIVTAFPASEKQVYLDYYSELTDSNNLTEEKTHGYAVVSDEDFYNKLTEEITLLQKPCEAKKIWNYDPADYKDFDFLIPTKEMEALYSLGYNTEMKIFYGYFEYDYSFHGNGELEDYLLIKEKGFTSLMDLQRLMETVYSKDYAAKTAKNLSSGDCPEYKEKDGHLYCGIGGRSSRLNFLKDKVISYAMIDETHMLICTEASYAEWIIAEKSYGDIYEYQERIYHLVKEDGQWKFEEQIMRVE